MSTKIETGINWTAVRAEMDCADWEQMDKWTEERLVFLGTVFNMCPSGSHEVYYDTLDREASRHGFAIVSGDGDPCDIFACETREIPDRDD